MSRTQCYGWLGRVASCVLLLTLALLSHSAVAFGQEEDAERHVRVPKSYANVHLGPVTFHPVLVLVPKDTVLPVVSRQGEWLEVELSPELKETGMVLRWYFAATARLAKPFRHSAVPAIK